MNTKEIARKERVQTILNSIKKAQTDGRIIDFKKLIAVTMFDFGVARRTAIEYIDAAKSQI